MGQEARHRSEDVKIIRTLDPKQLRAGGETYLRGEIDKMYVETRCVPKTREKLAPLLAKRDPSKDPPSHLIDYAE